MKITKQCTRLFLVLSLLVICTSTSFANNGKEIIQVVSSDGRTVNFMIGSDIQQEVSIEELTSIADSNTNTDNITIIDVGYASPKMRKSASPEMSKSANLKSAQALGVPIVTPPIKSYTSYNNFESDRFMTSCARGETKTVLKITSSTLSSNISGDTPVGSLGITASLTYSINESSTLTGPSEGSSYNSREYRCRFYENKGNWAQIINIYEWDFSRSGTFTEPSKYISYSKDTSVHQ